MKNFQEAEKRVSEDEEETEDTEETFLYKKSDVKTLVGIDKNNAFTIFWGHYWLWGLNHHMQVKREDSCG